MKICSFHFLFVSLQRILNKKQQSNGNYQDKKIDGRPKVESHSLFSDGVWSRSDEGSRRGEELTKKYGHGKFGDDEEIRLQIIVNDKEVKSSDFCEAFIDCISTNIEKKCRNIVSCLFDEKIDNIMREFEEMQSKAKSMNDMLSWDDVFNSKFIKTETQSLDEQ